MTDWFEAEFDRVVLLEGGYSNDPSDSGGATRYGITERVARANGYEGEMWSLPLDCAKRIYRRQYWDMMRLDDVSLLSPGIATELFDTGINAGTATAIRFLQRLLNALNQGGALWRDMTVDGQIGPITLGALRAYLARRGGEGERVLFFALNGLQATFYVELAERRATDERFLYGWLRTRVARGFPHA